MFSRPLWAFLCSWSGIETIPCCLDFDLVSVCSTLIPDALVLGMAVDLWDSHGLEPVRTPVAILGSLGVCIYVLASRHWLISYSPIHLN